MFKHAAVKQAKLKLHLEHESVLLSGALSSSFFIQRCFSVMSTTWKVQYEKYLINYFRNTQ